MRRSVLALAGLALLAAPLVAARADLPTPEPNFALDLLPRNCLAQSGNPYEAAQYEREGWQGPEYERYPGACRRLKFAFGPLTIKPGQNDVLIQPITVEKPTQDGFITRFKPDLVRPDGTVPPIEQIHLHHGTWISEPSYGNSAFVAAGEEKTAAWIPRGYGMPIKATDQWQLLYMVHSAVAQPQVVYITYEIDFVPQAKAQALDLRPAYPIWLDVRPSGYPVFNVQRSFGTGTTCTWPKEQCASVDPFGKPFTGQGQPGNGKGTDLALPPPGGALGQMTNFRGGTLIGIGGHLHPGGLQNEIDVVRGTQSQRIYTSEAKYWDRTDPTQAGGPPTSWDFSIAVNGLPSWGVHLQPGDLLRSNATYDTTIQSTYEDMGIAIAFMAPDNPDGSPNAPGVDPFGAPHDSTAACDSGGLAAPTPTLCDKGGSVTHGHLHENDNFGGPEGTTLTSMRAGATKRVDVGGFLYHPGDLSMVSMTGIPTVKLGTQLKFFNEDAFIDVYHTATSCGFPCTGPTGTSFPLANGTTSTGRSLDFDSAELGFGIPEIGPARQSFDWDLDVSPQSGFQEGEVVTYYCRIHPGMRGAFEVVG
jgi:plastocyanin